MNKVVSMLIMICSFSLLNINMCFSAGYILSYFGGSDGKEALYLAYSYDALNWIALKNNKPVLYATVGYKSIRDPYILKREDGKYEILSTNQSSEYIIIWDSDDLLTFKNERLVHLNTVGQHTWAPECIYDINKKNYVIYWSGDVTYCNTTIDFVSFSPCEKFFDPGYICIDADITAYNGAYYMFYKDERGESLPSTKFKALKEAKSNSLQPGSFHEFTPDYITDHLVEGPACIKDLNKNRWYLYYDYFTLGGIWGCSFTDDFTTGKWTKMNSGQYNLPVGVRHGNAVKVTDDELKKIIAKWK